MKFRKKISNRDKKIDKLSKGLDKIAKKADREIYDYLLDWYFDLEFENNKVVYSIRNISAVSKALTWIKQKIESFAKYAVGWIVGASDGISNANSAIYPDISETLRGRALRVVLGRWGYVDGEITPGGYIDTIMPSRAIAQKVGQLLNRAVASKVDLKTFRSIFSPIFQKSGVLLSHFRTNSFDLFQRIDRAINYEYALMLGYSNGVYTGTLKDNSRPKCVELLNKVLSFKEIDSLRDQDWKGKSNPYDPYLDCGGYNCRHHWSFVSDETAKMLKE